METFTETNKDQIARYSTTSIIVLAVLITINLVIAMGIQHRSFPDGTLRMVILMIVLFIARASDKKGFNELAKVLFLIGNYWASMIYPLMSNFESKPAEDIFICTFMVLLLNAVVVVLYRIDQWLIMLLWISIFSSTFYFGVYYSISELDSEIYGPLAAMFLDNLELIPAIIISSMLLGLITWKFKIEQSKANALLVDASVRLQEKEDDINAQNQELRALTGNLTEAQLEIVQINSSLEERVKNRLSELENINSKIVNYGFMHSQFIKNAFEDNVLLSEHIENLEDQAIQERIQKMTTELDGLVMQIAENLELAEKKL